MKIWDNMIEYHVRLYYEVYYIYIDGCVCQCIYCFLIGRISPSTPTGSCVSVISFMFTAERIESAILDVCRLFKLGRKIHPSHIKFVVPKKTFFLGWNR